MSGRRYTHLGWTGAVISAFLESQEGQGQLSPYRQDLLRRIRAMGPIEPKA